MHASHSTAATCILNLVEDEQSFDRYGVEVNAIIAHPRSVSRIVADLWDLSVGGCRLLTPQSFQPGDELLVKIHVLEARHGRVAWTGDRCVGVAFSCPLERAVVEHYARHFPNTPSPSLT